MSFELFYIIYIMDHAIISKLIQEQNKPLPGLASQKKMMMYNDDTYNPNPPYGKESAVLLNIYPTSENKVNIIFIERAFSERSIHSGQISFPGGKKENSDQDLIETALRESTEEINLQKEEVNIIRPLSPIYIPVSDYKVFPFLSYSTSLPKSLNACPNEVAKILHFDLNTLIEKQVYTPIETIYNVSMKVKAYQSGDYIIWGASAMILAELEALIKQ